MAGALVLALPLLSSCGFDKATDRPYTPAEGTNNRDSSIKILSAAVVSAQPDSGTFVATLSNDTDDAGEPATFDGLAGADDWQDLQVDDFDAVDIPYRGFVNLADGDGVTVTGDFTPGDFMTLTLTFGDGQSTTMDLPVVYACDEWEGLDTSASASASATASSTASSAPASASSSASPGEVPTSSDTESTLPTPSPSETSSASPSATPGETYNCDSVLEEE